MKKMFFGALLCAFIPFSYAQEAAQPANTVLQLFSCNLNPGQNADDVWSLLEALRAQVDSQGASLGEAPGIFLWMPFRTASDYDYVWGATNSDLVATMEGMASYASSGAAAALAARFQAVNERCHSMIAFSEQTKVSSMPFNPTNANDRMPDGVVETFSCKVRAGSTMADIRSVTSFWQEQVKKVASEDLNKYAAYLVTPFRGGTGEADFGWIGTYPDMVSFGRGETAFMNSKEGQAVNARFEKASTCTTSLWNGYWVKAPAA